LFYELTELHLDFRQGQDFHAVCLKFWLPQILVTLYLAPVIVSTHHSGSCSVGDPRLSVFPLPLRRGRARVGVKAGGVPNLYSRSASDRESKRYPNHASPFSAIGNGVFGISSGGDDARIAIRHGKRIEEGEGCLQDLPVGFHRYNQLVQHQQIMG